MFNKKPTHKAQSLDLDPAKMRSFRTTVLLDGENVGVIQNMLIYVHDNEALLNDLIRSTSPKAVADTFHILTNEVGKLFEHLGMDTDKMPTKHTAISKQGVISKEKR